jgi:hypothetical protein
MGDDKRTDLTRPSTGAEVAEFLRQVAAASVVRAVGARGRLIFAMDATASREPTWDMACQIQGQMFQETAALGGLDIQLCHYSGFGEFDASPWIPSSRSLLERMTAVRCRSGQTQIARVLRHAIAETRRDKVNALVFVSDCVEESVDDLCVLAGELALLGVPAFLFQEGGDPMVERAFRQIARLARGAYCRFDARSPQQLRDLLSAVAVYAAGGRHALDDFSRRTGGVTRQLTNQLDKAGP